MFPAKMQVNFWNPAFFMFCTDFSFCAPILCATLSALFSVLPLAYAGESWYNYLRNTQALFIRKDG